MRRTARQGGELHDGPQHRPVEVARLGSHEMADIEQTDGKLRVAGKTFIRTSDHSAISDLSVRVDQVALVTEHSFYAPPAGTRDKRPSPTLVALQGKATIEGSGVGLAILGSKTPPAVQLSIQIALYDEPNPTDNSGWAKRSRTCWPASVWCAAGEGWNLAANVPRFVHEQLTNAVAAERLVHLKCSVKLDAWMEEQTPHFQDSVIYLPPDNANPDASGISDGYVTGLSLRERPLTLGEPPENAAAESPPLSSLPEPRSRLKTVPAGALWGVLAALVLLIVMLFLLRNV